ncbi:manganese efflux pump MntP [Solibacillus sp. FSL K6-1523]|uniref:manganese efflux pump MntP n=1 Tax=Solibacillus sp. FSL K6-1523 TaxID=2921471 RepID=UPI0030F5FC86
MHWITIIVIGIAANLDNLGIGLAYGVKQTKIPFLSNVSIAISSMFVTYIAVWIGGTIGAYMSVHIANLLGSLLLCIIGLWTLISQKFGHKEILHNPQLVDLDENNVISLSESILLGFILSINCLAVGIGIGANEISAVWTVLSIGFFSIVTIGLGSHFGALISKTFIGRYSTAISGWLLIIIGIFEVFAR